MGSRKFRKIVATAVLLLGISLGFSLTMISRTSAAGNSTIVSKAVFEGVYKCFNNGAYSGSFYASNPQGFVRNNGSDDSVQLPYGMTNVGDNNLNCREIMLGYNNDSGVKGGLIPNNIRNSGSDVTTVKNYFAGKQSSSSGVLPGTSAGVNPTGTTSTTGGLGYNADAMSEGTGGVAKTFSYTIGKYNCLSGESNPSFNGKKTITFPTVVSTDSGLKITASNDISTSGNTKFVSNCGNMTLTVGYPVVTDSVITFDVILNGDTTQTIQYSRNGSDISITESSASVSDNNGNFINLDGKANQESAGNTTISDYKLTWGGGNWTKLVGGLNGNNRAGISVDKVYAGYNYLALTRQELFDLYIYYIENPSVFNAKLVAEDQSDYSGKDINLCPDKKYKVNMTNANRDRVVYGVDGSRHFGAGSFTLDALIEAFSAEGPFNDVNNGGRCEKSNENTKYVPSSSSVSDDSVDCNKFENIGAMQWILCPVMNNEQYTASWIDNMTQDWLEVKTDVYTGDTIRGVWENIRNIANIVMIVFFLVIIFSQVTGYGIDNYGIKKMLPRLIVMAILINLSFYICQLAIDLSNIAGVGLRNMFTSIGMSEGGSAGGPSFISTMIMGMFGAASTGGAAAVSAGTFAGGALASLASPIVIGVIVAVIVLLLVVLVAVVVLFLMLGAREIIIIVCVIISPLAFAAFILPNTQNLFKKWWEMFKAAIIIFPICGAMAGVSNLLRSMYKDGDELQMWGYAILMILPYLGFFLMPMLLKNAISALGKVGGALTSLGNTVRNGGRAIGRAGAQVGQRTNRFKDLQERANERNAQRAINKIKNREAKGRTVSEGDRKRALEATNKLNEIRQQRELAKLGGTELDDATIQSRALAIKEAQGLKNYSDQFANLTRSEMGTILADSVKDYGDARDEYNKAEMAYNSDKSDANKRAMETQRRILDNNALKLQAAIIASEGKTMNKEEADVLGGFKFDSSNATDAKILSRLAASSDKIISQYGIQMSKIGGDYETNDLANGAIQYNPDGSVKTRKLTEAERNISLNDFIGSQAEVKLSDVASGKGPSWLTTVNDDTLDAILKAAKDNPNALKALDTHSLLTVANTTTDGKVVTKVNQILQARKDANISENYSMGTAELAKLKSSTADMLEGTGVYDKAVADIKADPNSAANKQILNAMEQDVKVKLGLDEASLNPDIRIPKLSAKLSAMAPDDITTMIKNGKLTSDDMHSLLTSANGDVRSQIDGNADLKLKLQAGASGMMPTTANPTPANGAQLDWNNTADVSKAAESYRDSTPEVYKRHIISSTPDEIKNDLQSGKLTGEMAHDILTSGDSHMQEQIKNNGELRNLLEASASRLMPTMANVQIDWNNSKSVNDAAENYHKQVEGMGGSEYAVKTPGQVWDEAVKENRERNQDDWVKDMRRAANAMEQMAQRMQAPNNNTPVPNADTGGGNGNSNGNGNVGDSRDGDNIPRPDPNSPIPMGGPVQTFQPPAVVVNQPPAVINNQSSVSTSDRGQNELIRSQNETAKQTSRMADTLDQMIRNRQTSGSAPASNGGSNQKQSQDDKQLPVLRPNQPPAPGSNGGPLGPAGGPGPNSGPTGPNRGPNRRG